MEITKLKVLLKNISRLFHLSSHENINLEPVQKYYQKIEEILKLLKPILDVIVDAEVASDVSLQKASVGLSHSVDELRELFESWHPLMSKVYFVLQVESLMGKVRMSSLEIFEFLKCSDQSLPVELNSASLELCLEKVKHIGYEQASALITKSLRDHVEGSGPSSDCLVKITDCLSLKSNQEILIEAVALEKLKENAEQAEKNGEVDYIDETIALVTHMHERLVLLKQSESFSPVPIPADFCCPLSLELMTDPVIVASGQTYERAFIQKWIDLGLTVCPKTRQILGHTNLVPNYTVKAFIANWCESNNVKLLDPMKSMNINRPSSLLTNSESGGPRDSLIARSRSNEPEPTSPESTHSIGSSSEDSFPASSGDRGLDLGAQLSISPSRKEFPSAAGTDELSSPRDNRTTSASSTLSNANFSQEMPGEGNEGNALGELTSESQPAAVTLPTSQREPEYSPRFGTRSRAQLIWRRPSDRFVSRTVPSLATETRPDLSELEAQVKKLVEDLKSTSIEEQRDATAEIRLLARHNTDYRTVIANCGAISLLVDVLLSTDTKIQENAVTALLNLSINDNNKTAIANANAIEPLICILESGTPEAKENSAATLFSLSVIEENKIKIGRSDAIQPLVNLLGSGTPRGKKDAATALFNLSIFHETKARIVQAGAVKYLVELMDPAAGMVDKAVAVLSNLATIHEGRVAIGQEGGIPVLVEVVELGSARGKENAAAALLQLCNDNNRFCNTVLQEGAVPPLVALSQSGTPRAKEKAQALLNCFKNLRNGGRG